MAYSTKQLLIWTGSGSFQWRSFSGVILLAVGSEEPGTQNRVNADGSQTGLEGELGWRRDPKAVGSLFI